MCYASFVLAEKNMAHLLLWRQILTGGSRGVCIQGLEVKRSQSWEVVNMSFFACPTHKRAHPLQKSSCTTLYTFALCALICLLYTVWNKVMFVKTRGPYQLTAHWNPLLDTTVRGTMWNQLLIISDLFFQRHCKMICRGLANLWRAGLARPHCKLLFPFLSISI